MLQFQTNSTPTIILWDEENLLSRWEVTLDLSKLANWIRTVNQQYTSHFIQSITIIIVSDEEMCQLHQYYFNDPSPTDIITLEGKEEAILYLAPEFVFSQIESYRTVSFKGALLRVIIHGILHILGFSDSTPEEQQAMIEAENHALALWKQMNSNFTPL